MLDKIDVSVSPEGEKAEVFRVDNLSKTRKQINITIPFGEYRFVIFNRSNRNMVAWPEINGEPIFTDGSGIYVRAHDSVPIRRRGNPFDGSGPSFKFVPLTEEVADIRGNRTTDGTIEVTCAFEKYTPAPLYRSIPGDWRRQPFQFSKDTLGGHTDTLSKSYSSHSLGHGFSEGTRGIKGGTAGFTVDGEETHQRFGTITAGELETKRYFVVVRLTGRDNTTHQEVVVDPYAPTRRHPAVMCRQCQYICRQQDTYCARCGNKVR